MKTLLTLAGVASMTLAGFAAPQVALAQPGPDYGSGDVCHYQQHQAGAQGTVTGGIIGGVLGAALGGRHDRVGGAVVGGTLGAVAGHAIGRSSVQCADYPARISYHRHNCRWVRQDDGQGYHGFEVCRDPDGVWRPSGRD